MSLPTVGRLLIVDDESPLKNALCEMLAKRGYETAGFTSGKEALEALKRQGFDLLLTDLMMPEMDGIELLKAALVIDPYLMGIVMTGQATVQTAVEAMKVGAFDYLLKPFKLNVVLPVLSRAMQVRQLRTENVQLRESVAIYELSTAIAFALDPNTILSRVADAALEQCQADEVSILLPTGDGANLYLAVVRGERPRPILGEQVPVEGTVAGWVARHHQPILLQGEVNDPRFKPLIPRPEIRASISIPMLVAGKLLGVLNVNTTQGHRAFQLGQVKVLNILATIAAAALESASLYTEVREAESRFRSIFENAVEGIFRKSPDGRFLTANPALAHILGYTSPEELVASITDAEHQLYADPNRRVEFKHLLEDRGAVSGFEAQVYRKDGSTIWVSISARTIRDGDGRPVGYEGMLLDITERKRAEEALRRYVERLQTLREIDKAILVAESSQSTAGAALYQVRQLVPCLRASVALFDFEAGEVTLLATHAGGETKVGTGARFSLEGLETIVDALRLGKVQTVEGLMSFPQPPPVVQALQAEGVRSYIIAPLIVRGKLVGSLNLGLDRPGPFTPEHLEIAHEVASSLAIAIEQARLHEHVLRHATELEARVEERTRELAVANRELAVASRHKSEFLANMSHELRTPLNSVLGFAQLLLEQTGSLLSEKQTRYLTNIYNSGKHLLQLISDILDLSKVEAGKFVLQPEPLPVAQTLEDILVIGRGLAHKKAQTIQTEIEPDLPPLSADPVRFKQILFNLLSNAVKFTPDGGAITVRARTVIAEEHGSGGAEVPSPLPLSPSAPRQLLEVAVTDTGVGIKAGDLPRLFREFVQLETTQAQRQEGTGLGLALTKRLVEMHGGRIWVESQGEGRGSTFALVLPFAGPGHAGNLEDGPPGPGPTPAEARP